MPVKTANHLKTANPPTLQKRFPAVLRSISTETICLIVIVLIGAVLRVAALKRPLENDEAYTYLQYVIRPLSGALGDYSDPNNHLFHTLLAHFTTQLFGRHVYALRLPAFLAGVAMIPLMYLVTNRLFSVRAGLLSAAIIAGSGYMIDYSSDARGYTLITLGMLLMLCYADSAVKHDRFVHWMGLSLAMALSVYTIPSMAYAVVGVAAWVVAEIYFGHRAALKPLLLHALFTFASGLVMTLLLYLPVLLRTGVNAIVANRYVGNRSLMNGEESMLQSLGQTWADWHTCIAWPLVALLVVGLLAAIYRYRTLATHTVPILVPCIIVAIGFVLKQWIVPMPRLWIYLLPVYLAMASSGIVWLIQQLPAAFRLPRLALAIPLLSFLLLICLALSTYASLRTEIDNPASSYQLSRYLMSHLTVGDAIAAHGMKMTPILAYYYMDNRYLSGISNQWELQFWRIVSPQPAAESESPQCRLIILRNHENADACDTFLDNTKKTGINIHPQLLEHIADYDIIECTMARTL